MARVRTSRLVGLPGAGTMRMCVPLFTVLERRPRPPPQSRVGSGSCDLSAHGSCTAPSICWLPRMTVVAVLRPQPAPRAPAGRGRAATRHPRSRPGPGPASVLRCRPIQLCWGPRLPSGGASGHPPLSHSTPAAHSCAPPDAPAHVQPTLQPRLTRSPANFARGRLFVGPRHSRLSSAPWATRDGAAH